MHQLLLSEWGLFLTWKNSNLFLEEIHTFRKLVGMLPALDYEQFNCQQEQK
jgi:hypothetical protein